MKKYSAIVKDGNRPKPPTGGRGKPKQGGKYCMKIKDYDNTQLLKEFETACFRVTNYKSNIAISKRFAALEKEIARRLGADVYKINRE